MGGGQGDVYIANGEDGAKRVAKIYHKSFLNINGINAFLNNLKDLCNRQSPDQSFVWPIDYFGNGSDEKTGLIMDYFDNKDYTSLAHYVSEGSSSQLLVKIAISISLAFGKLHEMGGYFCDINEDDIFIKERNGLIDLKICDCDNTSFDAEYKPLVKGKRWFVAPEIMTKKDKHSIKTDLYSLSVMFFHLFVRLWPLEGRKAEVLSNGDDYSRFYEDPLFIFDRNDDSNPPNEKISDLTKKIGYWRELPRYVKNLFYEAFENGLLDSDERPSTSQWKDVLTEYINSGQCTGTRIACDKKRLNILLLVDTSGSMYGERIKKVNECLNLLRKEIKESVPPQVAPYMDVMSFDSECRWKFKKPKPLNEITNISLSARLGTDTRLDDAFKLLYYSVGPYSIEGGESFLGGHNMTKPIIILISDGEPTFDIDDSVSHLYSEKHFKSAYRLAFCIDERCKTDTFLKFTNDERTVCKVYDLNIFSNIIRKVTEITSIVTSTLQEMPSDCSKHMNCRRYDDNWSSNNEIVAESMSSMQWCYGIKNEEFLPRYDN